MTIKPTIASVLRNSQIEQVDIEITIPKQQLRPDRRSNHKPDEKPQKLGFIHNRRCDEEKFNRSAVTEKKRYHLRGVRDEQPTNSKNHRRTRPTKSPTKSPTKQFNESTDYRNQQTTARISNKNKHQPSTAEAVGSQSTAQAFDRR
ncbi:hypothetical protein ACFX14_008591 [Malus domestica]